jgi:hypothetical protein
MTQLSLNTTILSFAFSGVLGSHKRPYEAQRTVSQPAPKKK